MRNFFRKIKEGIERFIPMTLSSLVIFLFTLYLFFLVGRSIWVNYNSNKEIEKEAANIVGMENEIEDLKNQINYYQTNSYKEKEARAKLGYKAPEEKIMVLPLDEPEDKVADQGQGEVHIKTPNYRLWWQYYFDS